MFIDHKTRIQPNNLITMNIRNFKTGDESSLFQVYFSAIHLIAAADYTKEQIAIWAPNDMDLDRWGRHMRNIRPFVAEIDGVIVGYADVQNSGYIDHFFVSGNHARQGVATALMQRIHAKASILGLSELTSEVSITAEPFFIRCGFHVVKRQFPVKQGIAFQNALMRKNLTN
jgi:putative acetyltransferase